MNAANITVVIAAITVAMITTRTIIGMIASIIVGVVTTVVTGIIGAMIGDGHAIGCIIGGAVIADAIDAPVVTVVVTTVVIAGAYARFFPKVRSICTVDANITGTAVVATACHAACILCVVTP